MERAGLTRRMRDCIRFIESYIEENGASPNYDEIKIGLNITSKGNVCRLVDCLEARGWITRKPHSARSISLVGPGDPMTQQSQVRPASPRYELPSHLETALRQICAERRVHPDKAVADAVAIFIAHAQAGRAA